MCGYCDIRGYICIGILIGFYDAGREAPRVEIYPETTTIISAGSSALFLCRVIGGIPSPTVVWAR